MHTEQQLHLCFLQSPDAMKFRKNISFYFRSVFLSDTQCYQILIHLILNYFFLYLEFNFPIFFVPHSLNL